MRHLTPKEFYSQVGKRADVKRIDIAEKWCKAIIEVIIYECFFKHGCKIPLLGTFELIHRKEEIQTQNKNGEVQTFVVPEHFSIKFTPCDSFVNDVNGKGITTMYRKRVKDNEITKWDIERQLRFEKEKVDEYFRQQAEIKESLKPKKKGRKPPGKEKALKDFKEMIRKGESQ